MITVEHRVIRYLIAHPGATARMISEALFGPYGGSQHRVNPICLKLCESGKAHRKGAGTRTDPYRYYYGLPAISPSVEEINDERELA